MHMRTLFLLLSLSFLFACCRTSETPDQFSFNPRFSAIGVDDSRLARIDSLLQAEIDKGTLPHALTFVARKGEVIHHKAFGWKDVEKQIPLETTDIFRMYSQTKAIVTTALMTLFEEGKFQLDDPVVRYIPEMTDRVVVRGPGIVDSTRKAASPVTIRHLLSHSSGVNPSGQQSAVSTNAEYVKQLVQNPLLYDPGTDWNYHPALDVVAWLVEYFSGKPLQQYLQEKIFTPLGIEDMAYYYDESFRSRFVTMYRGGQSGLQPVEMWSGRNPFGNEREYAQGGTGLNGTIEGYARFCQMILNGGTFNGHRILGRRTIEMMSQNQLAFPNSGGRGFQFGLGFQIYPETPEQGDISNFTPMVSPNSLTWGGMANTDYLIDPKEELIVLLYTNRIPDTKIWEKFLNTVYQSLE